MDWNALFILVVIVSSELKYFVIVLLFNSHLARSRVFLLPFLGCINNNKVFLFPLLLLPFLFSRPWDCLTEKRKFFFFQGNKKKGRAFFHSPFSSSKSECFFLSSPPRLEASLTWRERETNGEREKKEIYEGKKYATPVPSRGKVIGLVKTYKFVIFVVFVKI